MRIVRRGFWGLFGLGMMVAVAAGNAQQMQPPAPRPLAEQLQEDWISLNIALNHVKQELTDYIRQATDAQQHAVEAEARLKWVLDNWIPKAEPPQAEK